MSGDVQPRKRKDKKRKKDDLGVEEPRGTAAALGEGDVFMHSHHDHSTGGHWCAKVIFFSLLFVLVGLIGLIILENRGLSELEANSIQSQYSGVLEGWLEDAPEDDHHDEHTLELNHHDDEHDEEGHSEEADDDELDDQDDDDEHDDDHQEDEHDEEGHSEEADDDELDDQDDDDEHDDDHQEDEHDEEGHSEEADDDELDDQDDDDEHDDDHQEDEDDEEDTEEDDGEQDEDDSQEQDLEDNDEEEDLPYRKYYHANEATLDDDDDDDQDEQDNDVSKEDDDVTKNDDDDDDDDVTKNDDDDDEGDDDVTKNDEGNDDVTKNEDDEEDEQDEKSNEVDQDDENDDHDDDNNQSVQHDEDEDENADSNEQYNEDEDEHEEEEEDASLELENIEKEAPDDEEPVSSELPALPEPDDDDDKDQESVEYEAPDADDADDGDDADDADNDATDPDPDDSLEADDDEPPVERITAPAGKPFVEVEEPPTEKPTDTLADEEEYEQRQEQLRQEEAGASSQMWLKLTIGGALLVATHAIIRRATASRDAPRSEEGTSREATPIERRMTLIPEEPSEPVPITKHIPSITRKAPTFEESEEEVEEEEEEEPVFSKVVRTAQAAKEEKKELYSDEEEADEDFEEEPLVLKKAAPAAANPKEPTPQPEDVPDDVEIIEEEEIEEDEPEDEEEISDVDDEELLTRLEAKYGRLPEPERPARRKDGGNSLEAGWPGEPADAYWRQQLDEAEGEYNQGAVMAAADRASAAQLKTSGRARWLVARALDAAAERERDNALLGRAIAAYIELLKMNERLSDKKLLEIAERTINRIQFRGTYLNAEPVYRLLIRRFSDEPVHRTNLTVMFLMANRGDLAEESLKETLKLWPNDRLALAQYGFILKTQHNRLEEALDHLQRALEGDTGAATEPRFYYHLGDTLLLLGRFEEAHEVHKRGAAHGHFLSPAQRSLYNVPKLEGRPWWRIEDTPYVKLARDLETNWKEILREGEAAKALYEQEKEGLKERGEWSQLDLFVRGREIDGRCARAPVTCAVVRREIAAAGCRRGQVKFSSMRAGTHVRAHVGPTNCRLRMHLGLSNTKDTFLRVHKETRQWETGKVFVFDDSFEHEVWHNGTGSRLVLIVDVWHPGLSAAERRQLPAI